MSEQKPGRNVTMSNTPFVWMLASLAVGIVCCSIFPSVFVCMALAAVAFCIYLYRRLRLRHISNIVANARMARWQFAALIMTLGATIAYYNHPGDPCVDYNDYSHLRGEITEANNRDTYTCYRLNVNNVYNRADSKSKDVSFPVLVYMSDDMLNIGDEVEIVNAISRIGDNPNFAEPQPSGIFPSLNPKHSISASEHDVRVLRNNYGSLRYLPRRIQSNILDKLVHSNLDATTKELLGTMLLADKASMTPELRSRFSGAGLAHILAVSGLHVGIVASIVLMILWPLRLTRFRQFRYPIAVALIWIYTVVCGMPISAVRAAIMLSFCMIAFMIEREYNALNVLCAAAFLILIFSPFSLFSPSMQFSFVAVYALIVILPAISIVKPRHKIAYYTTSTILSSIVASVAVLGLTAYWFGTVPLMFLPANLLVLPLLPCYMGVAIVYILLLYMGIDAAWIATLLDFGSRGIVSVTDYITESSAATIDLQIGEYAALLYFVTLVMFGIWVLVRRRFYALATGVCAASVVLVAVIFPIKKSDATGFIVTNSYKGIEIRHYNQGIDNLLVSPDSSINSIRLHNHDILTVNTALNDDTELPTGCIMIVGKNFRGSLRELLDRSKPSIVVLSAGVYQYRASRLRLECNNRRIPCHDIREQGPLRVGKMPNSHLD